MEYIQVTFPLVRPVFVDGYRCGETNAIIRVEAGTHTVTLGAPRDYRPVRRRPTVRDTSPEHPLVVEFQP